MIVGVHCVIYSRDAEQDRAFIRDVLRFRNIDVGGGWLIFGLPPSEIAVHPGDRNTVHELYLMCDDIDAFTREMRKRNVPYDEVMHLDWGSLTRIRLPGGGKLGIYEPHHPRPRPMINRKKRKKPKRRVRARQKVRRATSPRKARRATSRRKATRRTLPARGKRSAARRKRGARRVAARRRRSRR